MCKIKVRRGEKRREEMEITTEKGREETNKRKIKKEKRKRTHEITKKK